MVDLDFVDFGDAEEKSIGEVCRYWSIYLAACSHLLPHFVLPSVVLTYFLVSGVEAENN